MFPSNIDHIESRWLWTRSTECDASTRHDLKSESTEDISQRSKAKVQCPEFVSWTDIVCESCWGYLTESVAVSKTDWCLSRGQKKDKNYPVGCLYDPRRWSWHIEQKPRYVFCGRRRAINGPWRTRKGNSTSIKTSNFVQAARSLFARRPSLFLKPFITPHDLKMKLDATDLRYVTSDEFRVLTAVSYRYPPNLRPNLFDHFQVEMGSKNHEVVPLSLIVQISGLRNGGVNKLVGSLAKRNLVSRVQNAKCDSFPDRIWDLGQLKIFGLDDGYRLTYGGYDYLAMRALSKRDSMHSVGNQIGVGKESGSYLPFENPFPSLPTWYHDRYLHCRRFWGERNGIEAPSVGTLFKKFFVVWSLNPISRLGRVSFRAIKDKRDYLGKRKSASWLYMSRLAAEKEWAFMKVILLLNWTHHLLIPSVQILHEYNFPVPRPIDQARHTILMEFIDAYPL